MQVHACACTHVPMHVCLCVHVWETECLLALWRGSWLLTQGLAAWTEYNLRMKTQAIVSVSLSLCRASCMNVAHFWQRVPQSLPSWSLKSVERAALRSWEGTAWNAPLTLRKQPGCVGLLPWFMELSEFKESHPDLLGKRNLWTWLRFHGAFPEGPGTPRKGSPHPQPCWKG